MDIGRRVKTERKRAQLSQDALARLAGISVSAVAQIEQGERTDPHYSTLSKLADALGMSVGELLEEPALSGKVEAPAKAVSPDEGPDLQAEEERHSVYLEVFKKHMARRASAWDQQADEESSRFFADWRTSAAYAGEVIGEAFVLTRTAVKELCPAIDQDFALEDAVREHRELVDAVKNMLKVVDKVRARGAPALERAIQGDIDHAALEEARAEKEQLAKERRAAFKLLDGRQSA